METDSKLADVLDTMKLLKLDADKRKKWSSTSQQPREQPESTGDLLADIRKAGGSAAKASAMVNKNDAVSNA